MRESMVGMRRDAALAVAAVALAALGVGQALSGQGLASTLGLPSGPQAAALPGSPHSGAPALALRRLVPVDHVEYARLQPLLARLPDDTVVLDLLALESLEAAQDLVQSWRINHPNGAPLVCWLATPDDGDGLAAAVRVLSEEGCSALRVARVPRALAPPVSGALDR